MPGDLKVVQQVIRAPGGFKSKSEPTEQASLFYQGNEQVQIPACQILIKGTSRAGFQVLQNHRIGPLLDQANDLGRWRAISSVVGFGFRVDLPKRVFLQRAEKYLDAIRPEIPGQLPGRRNQNGFGRLSSTRGSSECVVEGTRNSAGRPADLRLSRRTKISSSIVDQKLAHRLDNLLRRGGDSSGVTVDFDFKAPHTVYHKGGHILEAHLKLVRKIERFVVRDNAERNVRLFEQAVRAIDRTSRVELPR